METGLHALRGLLTLAGPIWLWAWSAAFLVMVCGSSQSKAAEVEAAQSGLRRLGMLADAALPFLLFLHPFGAFILAHQSGTVSGPGVLPVIALIAMIGVLMVVPAILGRATAAIVPKLGRALHRAAPILAVAALALALYATWENAALVLDLYLRNRSN